ncbi:MAG: hypothetical protein AAGJ12_04800 [Bacteroidota bacterium]
MKKTILPILLAFLILSCESKENDSYCIGPIENRSKIQANPDDINGGFAFDYLITSQLKSNVDGSEEIYDLDYFVNTADGSRFLSPTMLTVNFGQVTNEFGSVDGIIIMPSGKTVVYVNNAQFNQKRALTMAMDGTRQDKMFNDLAFLEEVFNEAADFNEVAHKKPSGIKQQTKAYTAMVNSPDGERAKMTIHFAENTTGRTIQTGVPLIGLLVGVVKDDTIGECNRLAVYTKVESQEGTFEATLKKIEPVSQTFNGAFYKEATMGVVPGAGIFSSDPMSDEAAESLEQDYNKISMLLRELSECDSEDVDCKERIKLKMIEIQDRIQRRAATNASDPNALGTEGTDFANTRRGLERAMNQIAEKLVKQRAECERIDADLDNCKSNCRGLEQEKIRCKREIRELEAEGKEISCKLAELMGVEDAAMDCFQ